MHTCTKGYERGQYNYVIMQDIAKNKLLCNWVKDFGNLQKKHFHIPSTAIDMVD